MRCTCALPFRMTTTVLLTFALLVSLGCQSPEKKFAKHMEKGRSFFEQGKLAEAVLEYKNALQANPKSPDAYFRPG